MTGNLDLWNAHADIDPKFTKAIVGKAYRGTSPNPQYVIRCLTEMFGPVGIGFGWRVVAEEFAPLGPEVLHWCRIEFWHTDRGNTFDSYGQTKAVYPSKDGKIIVDEDAPKKSLTDAIIKAASQIGIAANIFLGRWDDQKYVAEVAAEFRDEEKKKPETRDPKAIADGIIGVFAKVETIDDLNAISADGTKAAQAWDWLELEAKDQAARVKAAFDARASELPTKGQAA